MRPLIWDLHCHLSGVPGETPEARLGQLIQFADRMGIARLCVSMGMEWNYDPSPEQLRLENDAVLQAVRRFPDRAFGFVYLNPKHTQASLEELNRCVRDGPMVGVKLWVALRCHAPELDPIIERAAELKAVVLQHTWLKITGNLPGGPPRPTWPSWRRGIRAQRSSAGIPAATGNEDCAPFDRCQMSTPT